jgi:hypothetical protein
MPHDFPHPPLALFRLLAHSALAPRLTPMASGLLNHGQLSDFDRELLISRVTARLGAEYEWGIHAELYGLSPELLSASVHGAPDDLLFQTADELLDDARLSASTLAALEQRWSTAQIVEMHLLCGWYRTLSTLMLSAELPLEPWAAKFPEACPDPAS